jgi:two-component system, sporulation sensor kinase B
MHISGTSLEFFTKSTTNCDIFLRIPTENLCKIKYSVLIKLTEKGSGKVDVTKQMILNLALLLVLLFSFGIWFERRQEKSLSHWSVFLYFFLSIILSLTLSVKSGSQIRFDLRQVPLIVGGIYLGRLNAIFLLTGTILVRSVLGVTDGFWVSSFIYFVQTMIGISLYSWIHRLSTRKRIAALVVVSLYSSFGFVLFMNFTHHPLTLIEWTSYIVFSCLGVGIITATIEAWKQNQFLRQKIMKTEKIEAISQMSAAISHEVRNPLTAVRGFLQLLKEKDIDEKKRIEFIEIALLEVMRAEEIINDYLTFAKPSLDHLEEINVATELTQSISIIRALANMNSIEMVISLHPNLYVLGDQHRFKQCMVNILKNGAEAMPKGGALTISCFEKQNEVNIKICDTGIGMTREQIDRLGEPYYSTKGSNGTGLGMMVSHGIIRAMNGKIFTESEVGKGTTFRITFPSKRKRL